MAHTISLTSTLACLHCRFPFYFWLFLQFNLFTVTSYPSFFHPSKYLHFHDLLLNISFFISNLRVKGFLLHILQLFLTFLFKSSLRIISPLIQFHSLHAVSGWFISAHHTGCTPASTHTGEYAPVIYFNYRFSQK